MKELLLPSRQQVLLDPGAGAAKPRRWYKGR
jgi:hypothetical protein